MSSEQEVLARIKSWQEQGVTFRLRPDGKFLVEPMPSQGSALFQFCKANRDRIAVELWLQEQGREPDLALVATSECLFAGEVVGGQTWREMLETLIMIAPSRTTALFALSDVIAVFDKQGLQGQKLWAIQAFIHLGSELFLSKT